MKIGGPDDLVIVGGDLSFNAPTVIRVIPVGPLGTHTLFTYTGTLSGTNNIQFTAPRPLGFALDTSVPGVVAVTISGGVTLDWNGGTSGAPTAWDVNTTTNWLNAGTPDVFFGGDAVNFGDAALTNLVTLVASVQPASLNFINSSTPYTLTGPGGITSGGLTTEGGADVTLENSGNVTLTGRGLGLNAGTLTFNQPTNTTLTAKLSGYSGMAKAGASTLTVVSADSTNFLGTVAVNGGSVRLGSLNALGDSTVTVASGATLDVNGYSSDLASVQVGGAGADGLGAINNRGGLQTNAFNNVTLTGDTVLGAFSNRWDVAPFDTNGTPGTFAGNNYRLTKTGTNDLWIRTLSDTALGNIEVQAGRLVFAGAGTLLGDTSSNIVVRTNAALGFASGVQDPGKPTLVEAGGSLYSVGSTNLFGGAIVLSNGLVRLEPNTRLGLSGDLSGPAKLTVQGFNAGNFGTLILSGSNTYTGGTLVNDGDLVIASSNSIPANTNIVLNSRVPYNSSGHPIVTVISNVVTPAGVTLEMQTIGTAGAAQAGLSGNGATWSGPILITGNQNNCAANFSSGMGGLTINGAIDATGFTANLLLGGSGGVRLSGDSVLVSDPGFAGVGLRFNQPLQLSGSLSCNNTGLGGQPGMTKLVLATNGNSWAFLYWTRGVIQIEADNALPPAQIQIGTLQAGADHRVALDLNGRNQTLVDWRETFVGNDQAWFGNTSTNTDSELTYTGTGTNTWSAHIIDAFDITNAAIQMKTALKVTAGYLRLVPGLTNPISGAFGSGPPPWPMASVYSGSTTVSGGTLRVDSEILNSPVTVSGSGILTGTNRLGAGLTVVGGGTLSPGATFAPGTNIGTLTVSSNLSLGGNCVMEINPTTATNDKVVGINAATYGGTLSLVNVGGPFAVGNTFTLFSAATYGGSFSSVTSQTPGQFVTWNTNNLVVDGSITVASVTSSTPPSITNSISGSSLTMTWPVANTGWQLQTQTNSLSTGISPTWYSVAGSSSTNSVTVTIVPSNPTVFFRLVYP
jgi:fibronectin-binding autotransporter adhesin